MISGFDLSATEYDNAFTYTPVGMLQRNSVYRYLKPYLSKSKGMHILEINCGTGEDALLMAEMGHSVLATDLSLEMLARGRAKAAEHQNISFLQMDINRLASVSLKEKADIIFSNFGGLNCISPVQFRQFLNAAENKLDANGLLIAVIMPKNCLWNRLYSLLKGKPKMSRRRNSTKAVKVEVEGIMVDTWYYNPKEIEDYAKSSFRRKLLKPIGFLVPPSYLNAFFKKKKGLLSMLAWFDKKLFPFNFLSAYADHFIIVLEKK
ncbi:MAG TPA: class I SAM-dependent methyltransferase [Eudoraea sp.]|nr:class I SAM-dependent methyltransferase [Eudoraea sp.]